MTKNDKKIRLLYLLELQMFDNQKLAITTLATKMFVHIKKQKVWFMFL